MRSFKRRLGVLPPLDVGQVIVDTRQAGRFAQIKAPPSRRGLFRFRLRACSDLRGWLDRRVRRLIQSV